MPLTLESRARTGVASRRPICVVLPRYTARDPHACCVDLFLSSRDVYSPATGKSPQRLQRAFRLLPLSSSTLLAPSAVCYGALSASWLAARGRVCNPAYLCMECCRPGVTYTRFRFHLLAPAGPCGASATHFFSLFGDASFITNVHALRRLEPEQGHSERHTSQISRQPISLDLGSFGTNGFGLAEDDQYADVSLVIPACRVEIRQQQLSGQLPLPAWSHRKQRPARPWSRSTAQCAENVGLSARRPLNLPLVAVIVTLRRRCADASRADAPEEHVQSRHGLAPPRSWMLLFAVFVLGQAAIRELRSRWGSFSLFAGICGLTVAYIAFFTSCSSTRAEFKRLQPAARLNLRNVSWHERL